MVYNNQQQPPQRCTHKPHPDGGRLYNPALRKKLVAYTQLWHTAPATYQTQHDETASITNQVRKTYPSHNPSNPEAVKNLLPNQHNDWPTLIRDEIQRLGFDSSSPTASFDLLDFYRSNFPDADLSNIEEALDTCIPYKAHTPYYIGQPIRAYCGLSTPSSRQRIGAPLLQKLGLVRLEWTLLYIR